MEREARRQTGHTLDNDKHAVRAGRNGRRSMLQKDVRFAGPKEQHRRPQPVLDRSRLAHTHRDPRETLRSHHGLSILLRCSGRHGVQSGAQLFE